ncbi:hypothetical protein C922_04369 [Plasmodium inui San Antonio 1]|uniref:PX domain-containing protein n=1 Tax=Plasmodium inui San Antonio 1 TaxID=1237626 RepID=W7A0U2_9APIC|nr:hypothetical protein C922_04369 [Plasmodium inui San Antonio 1]EUD65240.1 hypothetical protein C922_04369 [Plasmodium inui San Antonio 1]
MEGHTEYEFKDNLIINIIRTNDVKRHFYSYTEYVLEFKALNSQKVLKKRFSDFVTFYEQLKNELLDKFSEYLEKISVLPSKKVFGRLNYNFVEERRQQLELFLKRISSHKNVYLCDRFYDFLCLDSITKCLFKLMCTEMTDLINLQKLLKKINYILFLSRSNTLKSAECDIINFLFHLKKNLQLNNEMKFFILNVFLHHLTYTKTPENLLNVPLMKFAFEIIYDNLCGDNINDVLLKTASETILRIVDKKNDVFLEYLQVYNFKEIFSIFSILSRRKRKKESKTDNITFNVYILMSLLLLSSIHLNAIQNYFSVKNKSNKGIVILGFMYESQNINIQVICCIILSLLLMNDKINDEEVVQKTKMSILLIQKEIQNLKDVDYQLIEIICSKKNISLLNNILVALLRGKSVVRQVGLGEMGEMSENGLVDEIGPVDRSVGAPLHGSFSTEGNPLEKDPFYEQKVKHADFSNNDIILQFILFIINIGISEFFLLKRNYKHRMRMKELKLRLKKKQLRVERLRRRREKKERAMLMLKDDQGNTSARRPQGDNTTKDAETSSYNRKEPTQRLYDYDIESVDEDCVYKREYVSYGYAAGRETSSAREGRRRTRRRRRRKRRGAHTRRDVLHQGFTSGRSEQGGTDGVSDLEGEENDREDDGEEDEQSNEGSDLDADTGEDDQTDATYRTDDTDGSDSKDDSDETLRGEGDDAWHRVPREYAQAGRGPAEKGEAEEIASTASSCISSLYSFSSDCSSGGEKEDILGGSGVEENRVGENQPGAERRAPPIDIDMSAVRDVTYEEEFSVDSGSIKDDIEYLEGEHSRNGGPRKDRGDSGGMRSGKQGDVTNEKRSKGQEEKLTEPVAMKESDEVEAIKEDIRALRDARKKFAKRIRRINEQILLILCNENMVQSIFKCANLDNEKIRVYACLILSYVPNISEVVSCTSVTPGGVASSGGAGSIGGAGSSDGYLKLCREEGMGASTNNGFHLEGPGTTLPLPDMHLGEFGPSGDVGGGVGRQGREAGRDVAGRDVAGRDVAGRDDICVVVNPNVMLAKKNNKNFVCSVEGDYYNYIYRFEILSTLLRYLFSETSFYDNILQHVRKFLEEQRHLVNLNHFKIKQTELINMVSFLDMRSERRNGRRRKKGRSGKIRARDRSGRNGDGLKDRMSSPSEVGHGMEEERRPHSAVATPGEATTAAASFATTPGGGTLLQYEATGEDKKNNYQCVPYEPSQIYDHMDYVFRYVTNVRKLGLLNNLIVELYTNLRKKVSKADVQFLLGTLNKKVEQREHLRRGILNLKEKYEYVNVTYNEYINLQYETNKQMGVMNKLLEELEEIEKRRRKAERNHKVVHTNVCNYRKKLIHVEKMIEESPSIKKCLYEEISNIKKNVALYKKDKKKISLLILLNKFCLDDFHTVSSKLKCLNTSIANLELLFNEFERNGDLIVSELSYLICTDLILVQLLGGLLNITVHNDNLPHLIARANCVSSWKENSCGERKLLIVNRDRGVSPAGKRNILHFAQSSDLMGDEEEYGYYDARDGRRVSRGGTLSRRGQHGADVNGIGGMGGMSGMNGTNGKSLQSSDSEVGRATANRFDRRKGEKISKQRRGRPVGSDEEDAIYPHEGSQFDGSPSRRNRGAMARSGLYDEEDPMGAPHYGRADLSDHPNRGDFLPMGSHHSASNRLRAEGARYNDLAREHLRRQGRPGRGEHPTYDDEDDDGAEGLMSDPHDMHSMTNPERRNLAEGDQPEVDELDDFADIEFVSSDEEDAELKGKIHEYNMFKSKEVKGVQPEEVSIDSDSLTREVFDQILQIVKARRRELESITSSENNQVYKNIHKYNSLLNKCNVQIEMQKQRYAEVRQQIASINTASMVKKSESIYKAIRECDDKVNLLNDEVKLVESEKKEKQKEIALHKKKLDKKEKEKNQKKEELRLLVTDMYRHNNQIKRRFKREQKVLLLVLYNSWFFFHYIYIIYLNTLKLKNYLAYKHSISEECRASAKQTISNISHFSELLDENDY